MASPVPSGGEIGVTTVHNVRQAVRDTFSDGIIAKLTATSMPEQSLLSKKERASLSQSSKSL
jgi:hypothetical protein